jgi:type III restriction enzyme
MVADIVTNPFVARDMVAALLAKLTARGFGADMLGRMSSFIIDELRKVLAKYRDEQAAVIFRAGLESGVIEFRVRGDSGDWVAPDHIWTSADEGAAQLPSKNGGALKRSLFLPVYASDLNNDETNVAIYLDDEAVIRWWHRNGTDRRSYALRGWRRGNVYPDFVFAALRDDEGERIVAVESKGDQLSGNMDTAYKTALLETLANAFGRGRGDDGNALPLKRDAIDFDAAVVLFSEWKAKLPLLIKGNIPR